MKKKLKIGIIFGGRSAEHEVSLESAKSILAAIDRKKYDVVKVLLPKSGPVDFAKLLKQKFDVVFPVLHGPFGEDGTIQGLLKLAGIPFVGPDVLGSAIGMDKDLTKRLLKEAGVPVAKFLTYTKGRLAEKDFASVKKILKTPFFVKPANLGSSVGISKVRSTEEFKKAIAEAFTYDHKIIIEENIVGREIECSVLGNEEVLASLPGEVIPQADFYSYDAKYLDENGALFEVPAKLSKAQITKIKKLAIQTFQVLCCEGMARVDFFLKKNGELLVNEINTIPGFTPISMYPKLWEASGLTYSKLIDILITLALTRLKRDSRKI